MKNGFNISGSSETVHEICNVPAEAILSYAVRAEPISAGVVSCAVQSIRAGTIRVARDFRFDAELAPAGAGLAPSPVELLLTSLAGCVLFTWVQGCTVKGVTIYQLGIKVEADAPARASGANPRTAAPLSGVRYTVSIEGDGSRETIAEIARKVTCFSPTHRSFIEGNDPRVRIMRDAELHTPRVVDRRPRGAIRLSPGSERAPGAPLSVALDWRYGAHSEATIARGADRESQRLVFDVDQPKQLNGLDRAPNPQEYMMAALAAEVLGGAPVAAISSLTARGDVDLRGFFNTGQTDVVKVHNIVYEVAPGVGPNPDLESLVANRIAASVTHRTVVTPSTIDVRVVSGGETITELRSDVEAIHRIMATLAPRETFI